MWYFEFERELFVNVGQKEFTLHLYTNWPGKVSAVVAKGIFGKQTIKEMLCGFLKLKKGKTSKRICIAKFKTNSLNPQGESFFWFIAKIGGRWIYIPNPRVINLPPSKWHAFLGTINRK